MMREWRVMSFLSLLVSYTQRGMRLPVARGTCIATPCLMQVPPLTSKPQEDSFNQGHYLQLSTELSEEDGVRQLSRDEVARQVKLAALLVKLGAAKEENVFGSAQSELMKTFRDGRAADLLVVNRREDEADRHPFDWYNPATWLSSGVQVSQMTWGITPQPIYILHPEMPTPRPSAPSATDSVEAAAVAASVSGDITTRLAADGSSLRVQKLKSGLPPVVMKPLPVSEVDALTPAVFGDREKLLKSEEAIHTRLQGIEDTRYRYLVPSIDMACETELTAVVKCYHKYNAVADAKRAARRVECAAEVDKRYSNKVVGAGDLGVPLVALDVLACGPVVSALKKCTAEMVRGSSQGRSAGDRI